MKPRLAIITSHPIQYYAPWFCYLTQHLGPVKVFYLWDAGVTQKEDRGFGRVVQWDIPLLAGYEFEFVPNVSKSPGTHHFRGLNNPQLKERVLDYKPTAVLLLGYNFLSYYHFLLGWRTPLNIPLIFRGDSHRLVTQEGIKEHLRKKWISSIFHRFSAFLYVGQANYRYFRYHNVAEAKLFFTPHAVDNERFSKDAASANIQAKEWKRALGIPENEKTVLFAGKFEPKKRPLDLLRAFVLAKLPHTSLLMVGNGELEDELKKQAALFKNVYFAPFQNQTQMQRTYLAGDLFVLPSYGSAETWGLAINEAMCLGLPVIVSDQVGCAEDLVHPGKNGLIFPAGDVAALAACLKEAFKPPEKLQSWGQESRKIIEKFSYQQATQGLKQALAMLEQKR